MSEQMKRCPFCNGLAEFDDCCDGGYKVLCSNCLVESPEPTYRSFLFETKSEAIDAWNKRAESEEITTLRQQLEQAEARCAELESVCMNMHRDLSIRAEPHDWDNPNSCKVVNLSAGYWDQLNSVLGKESKLSGVSADAWLLRKQAEALERCGPKMQAEEEPEAYMWDLSDVNEWLEEEAQRLRTQADELEKNQ